MTRSPLAYPLNRGTDMDAGGAADLQTDVMRFMAILSLCLVAIFALVQSMPAAPPQPAEPVAAAPEQDASPVTVRQTPEPQPVVAETLPAEIEQVTLTRPKWTNTRREQQPQAVPEKPPSVPPATETAASNAASDTEVAMTPAAPEGFTLRFESDAALTRLVASNKVGVYAIADERARRMSVAESRVSFWDASLPNSFHEMDPATVPGPVVDALSRAGVDTGTVRWGVTLPGKLKGELEEILREHRGGALVITPNGSLRLETS